MSLTDYLVNGLLVALVIRQLRGSRLTPLKLIWPLGLVALIAAEYLHGIPTAGNDLLLAVGGAVVGATLGTLCGVYTSVRRDADGSVIAKAGALAAVLWIAGVGSRIAFEIYATHGGGRSIERFSAAHGITSMEAWVACLVLMALAEVVCRIAVLAVRGRAAHRDGQEALVPVPAGSRP